MLGFTRLLFDISSMEPVDFSIIFTVLVASVQPNLRCYDVFFLQLTVMVTLYRQPTTDN